MKFKRIKNRNELLKHPVNDLPFAFQNTLSDLFVFSTALRDVENIKLPTCGFSETNQKSSELLFFIDNQIIDVVQEYTYLGTRNTSPYQEISQCYVNISRRKLFMPTL